MSDDKPQSSRPHGHSHAQDYFQPHLSNVAPTTAGPSSMAQPSLAQDAGLPASVTAGTTPVVNTATGALNTTNTTASADATLVAASMEPKRIQPLDTFSSFSAIGDVSPTSSSKTPGLSIAIDLSRPEPDPVAQQSPPVGNPPRRASASAIRNSTMLASPTAIPPSAFITGFMAGPSNPIFSRSNTSPSIDGKPPTGAETSTPLARVKSKGKDKEKPEKDKSKKDTEKSKEKGKDGKDKKTPEMIASRPVYSLSTMGLGPPLRSFSYTGPGTSDHLLLPATAASGLLSRRNSNIGQNSLSPLAPATSSSSIRKSQSVGKTASKKGFTTRFRKLRKRQGSASRDSSGHNMITSGESDSEPAPDRYLNHGGYGGYHSYANYMVPFRPPQPRTPRVAGDADLPPPPPVRSGSADARLTSTSNPTDLLSPTSPAHTNFGIAPFSIVTRTPATGELSQPLATERESSSVRFKDLLRRNVTIGSNPSSPSSVGVPLSASSAPSPVRSSKRSLTRGATFWSDFLSGDDTPGSSNLVHERARSSTARFSVSRLSASGRRKRRMTKKQLQTEEAAIMMSASPHTDEDDVQAMATSGRTGRRRPHHYQQWFQQLNRHRSRSADPGTRAARLALVTTSVAGPFPPMIASENPSLSARSEPAISNRLHEAREATTDPNTLVAELEPIPLAFKYALHGKIPVIPSALQPKVIPTASATVSMAVDDAAGGEISGTPGLLGAAGGAIGGCTGGLGLTGVPPAGFDVGISAQYHFSGDMANPLASKSFLFMAYQNSKFHRFYTFRVQGDTVQYAKLPVSLEQGCLHYFREASITYRRIEQSAKDFREKKRQAMEHWLRVEKEAQILLNRVRVRSSSNASRVSSTNIHQQHQHYQHHQQHNLPAVEVATLDAGTDSRGAEATLVVPVTQSSGTVSPRDETDGSGVKSPSNDSTSSTRTSTSPTSPDSTASEVEGLQQVVQRFQEFRLDDHGDDPAAPLSRRASMDDELITHRTLSMTPVRTNDNDNNDKEDKALGNDTFQETQRAAPVPTVHLNIPVVKTPPNEVESEPLKESILAAVTVADASNDKTNTPSPKSSIHSISTLQVPGQQSPASPLSPSNSSIRHRKRSWSSLRERQRQDHAEHRHQMVRRQRMAEEMLWQQQERALCHEAKMATYGLDLFLWEILKNVEYEKFDFVTEVGISNENRDSTLVSIVNGDRTNHMWLESPSAKLKQEFLNWIVIALMDYTGEPDYERHPPTEQFSKNPSVDSLALWIEHKYQYANDHSSKEQGPVDLLLDMTSLKIAELENTLLNRRQGCERAMREMDECLRKLDDLDRQAEKLKHFVLDAVGSQEVQKALLPAPNSDKTLAQTVEAKLKDVNERIVFVTKVMVSARHDLNRLRYEIELEQRSIRLFRQYKIVIGVVTVAALLCLWYLYYQRGAPMQRPELLFESVEKDQKSHVATEPRTVGQEIVTTIEHHNQQRPSVWIHEEQIQKDPHQQPGRTSFLADTIPSHPSTSSSTANPTCGKDGLFECTVVDNPL